MISLKNILHDEKIEFNQILPDDLKCKLCEKIMIDAHGLPCGCVFCKLCIESFLMNNTKCPGDNDVCNADEVKLEALVRNCAYNRKIDELETICLNEKCNEKVKIKNVLDHVNKCDFTIMNCPYKEFGCNFGVVQNKTLKSHLEDEALVHTEMMQGFVNKLKERVKQAEEENIEYKKMNEELKNENNDYKVKLEELQKYDSSSKEMEKIMKECEEESNDTLQTEKEKLEEKITKISSNFASYSYEWDILDFRNVYLEHNADNKLLISPMFYLKGYHLKLGYNCLPTNANCVYNHYLRVALVEGEHDNILPWPCQDKFNISIIKKYNKEDLYSIQMTNNGYWIKLVWGTKQSLDDAFRTNNYLNYLDHNGTLTIRCAVV